MGGTPLPWIDTHVHPLGGRPGLGHCLSGECIARALEVMDRHGVVRALLVWPPSPDDRFGGGKARSARPGAGRRLAGGRRPWAPGLSSGGDRLAEIAGLHRDRLSFLGGGLQALIGEAVDARRVSGDLRRRFEDRVRGLVRAGAVGLGEMTALHFSFHRFHPFVEVPPDHPLFLRLADLAAEFDVPIDLHMEAAPAPMATPSWFLEPDLANPPTVGANIGALERLLAHDRRARIVWAHVGWDNTGQMTVALLRRLLAAHRNLYLQIRIPSRPALFPGSCPLDEAGALRPQWRALVESFPDRVVLGSDSFMARPDFEVGVRLTSSLLRTLPRDLARKVGLENARRIYRLP